MPSQKRPRASTQDANGKSSKRARINSTSSSSSPRDAGQIEYIHLENFMCHRNLEVSLTSGVNVVTGNNGSGKSAILAGLQVALGSKAKSTNRGSSMKEVIKEGEDSCRVTVHLSNGGEDAYESETYGSRIIVVRRLSKTSTSSYKLQDEDGHTVSSSVKDLRKILDHFNIHLDNPCTVMNQDVSRVFLANATPSNKYRFFLEATQLQRMIEDFEESMRQKNGMERVIEQKQESLRDSKRQLDVLKKEFDDASHLKNLDHQIEQLDNQIIWAAVKEREVHLQRFQQKYDEIKNQKAQKVKSKETLEKKRVEIENQIEQLREQLVAKTTEFEKQSVVKDQTSEVYASIKKQSGLFKRNIDDWKSRIAQSKNRVRQYEREIANLEKEANRDKSGELRAREEKLAHYNKMLADNNSKVDESRKQLENLLTESQQAEDETSNARSVLNEIGSRIKRAGDRIDQMRRQNQDPLAYYKPNMRRLLQELERNRNRFQRCPIGPLGMMIKMKDLSWAGTVQFALKSSLTTFVVDNSKDRQLLMSIAQRCGIHLSAVTQKFSSHVYSQEQLHRGGVPDRRYTTMLNVIEADPVRARITGIQYESQTAFATAINVLIDQANIATTILARDDTEAKQIMFGVQSPANVVACYSRNGSRFQKKGSTEVVDPRKSVLSTFWAENFDAQIQELSREKQELQDQYRRQQDELKKCEQNYRSIRGRMNKQRQVERDAMQAVKHAQMQLERIEREPLPEQNDKNDDEISFRKEQIAKAMDEQKKYQADIEKSEQDNQETLNKIAEAERKMRDAVNQQEELRAEMATITGKMERVKSTIQVLDSNANTLVRAIEALDRGIIVLETKIEEQTKHVESSIKLARDMCPERPETNLSKEELNKKREELNQRRNAEQQRFGGRSIADIEADYTQFLRGYTHNKENVDSAVADLKTFQTSLQSRYTKWINLRKFYINTTNHYFNLYLSQKGHSGRLDFNLEDDELETVVFLSSSEGNQNEVKDTKSLSGGERSFTTTAFLLALWKAVESPFRCLDEFDVFMDAIYRKKAFDMLIQEALRNKTRQLIIITPHDVSILKGDIHIVRLRPPARNGMQQQTLHEFS